MAITEATEFDRVRIIANEGDDVPREILYIDLMLNGARVESLQPIDGNANYGWDPTTTEFGIVRRAVESGDAEFEYLDTRGAHYSPGEDVPAYSQWMVDENPIKNEIDLASSIEETDSPPAAVVIYKAQATAPTADPPRWSATNNTWDKWRAAIEAAGYSVITPPTPGGGEFLWEIAATYARTDGVYECVFDEWATDATLYSTDNGVTYSTTRPANTPVGNARINYIRRFNASLGQWVDEPFSPQFQGSAGGGLAHRSFVEHTRGNRYIQSSAELPRDYLTRGIQSGRVVKVGVELLLREDWHDDFFLRGYTEVPIDLIPLVAPSEVGDASSAVPVARKTFAFSMSEQGRLGWGIVETPAQVNDYYGDHHKFSACFMSNPYGTLAAAISATDTVLRLAVRPTGITTGSTIYLVAADGHTESVRPTLAPSQTPFVAPAAEGGYEYWAVNVARGGRDGARAWPAGAKWHADFSTGQEHSVMRVFSKSNIHAASEVRLYQAFDQ